MDKTLSGGRNQQIAIEIVAVVAVLAAIVVNIEGLYANGHIDLHGIRGSSTRLLHVHIESGEVLRERCGDGHGIGRHGEGRTCVTRPVHRGQRLVIAVLCRQRCQDVVLGRLDGQRHLILVCSLRLACLDDTTLCGTDGHIILNIGTDDGCRQVETGNVIGTIRAEVEQHLVVIGSQLANILATAECTLQSRRVSCIVIIYLQIVRTIVGFHTTSQPYQLTLGSGQQQIAATIVAVVAVLAAIVVDLERGDTGWHMNLFGITTTYAEAWHIDTECILTLGRQVVGEHRCDGDTRGGHVEEGGFGIVIPGTACHANRVVKCILDDTVAQYVAVVGSDSQRHLCSGRCLCG